MRIDDLNQASAVDFVAALGGIYEHSPWVAEAVCAQRPFASLDGLTQAMAEAVAHASPAAKLALIRAHPQLAGKAAVANDLTEASQREQRGAGLDRCTPDEFQRLTALNAAYEARFDFPFILAVAGHTRDSILAALQHRLANTVEQEFDEALRQIDRIAALRLQALLGHSAA
ncbi:MAG TPA: 2-oxo-4-hydroxy-4-carboxy-5-ureidoimidazoline decarboxylase [Chiayiivirga sp.]|nr:2-oxo-4-hydroxy-4-carboxy-5-ureidoimidazoline decarboxylase [Chiayiivirga sp.]